MGNLLYRPPAAAAQASARWMAGTVTLRCEECVPPEEHIQTLVDGGHLDWLTVEKVFQADVVEVLDSGAPALFHHGDNMGLTRDIYHANTVLRVSVVKKGAAVGASTSAAAAGAPGAAANAPHAEVAVPLPVCLPVEPPDQREEDTFGRVSRLLDGDGNTIGTCVRVGMVHGSIILTARHCVELGGRCLGNLQAFQGGLTFAAARADLDVVAFRGPDGPSFVLSGVALRQGMPVSLLSFPLAYDKELELPEISGPALDNGVVSNVSHTGQHALATFGTGMPNSSGGAVVSSTRTLVGLYTGTVWHLQEIPDSHRSSSSSSSGGGGRARPPAQLEVDPAAMWQDPDDEDMVEAAAATDSTAAQLSRVNIAHKTSASMFIPVAALLQFLQAAGLAADDPVDAAGDSIARRLRERKRSGRP